VESEIGKGCTFTIFLPATYVAHDVASRSEPPPPSERTFDGDRPVTEPPWHSLKPRADEDDVVDVFDGKKVLVVDDDVRNIYALAALLEDAGMSVVFAENGREAIDVLEATPDVGMILMDVMMPEMDGYETMRRVRQMPAYQSLPILALTAKAMKGDRDKCLVAGASDYVTKPVDAERLLSLMRVWFHSSET
jgi:CheY-like chemotaxis protein